MGKLTNPKTLKGQDKINRMKDLMKRMNTISESTSLSEIDFIKKGPNNIVYGIIRENHDYFIKTTDKTSGTLMAEDFNYIGGLQNKYDERYKTYTEALKQLNMKFDMLNDSYGIESGSNLFESDAVEVKEANASGLVEIKEEEVDEPEKVDSDENPEDEKIILDEEPEDVDEQKKVIKVDAPAAPAPVEDEVEVDEFAVDDVEGGDPFATGEEDMEGEEGLEDMEDDGDETTKKIQKYTGKVGQLLRDKDEPDPELDKYVINSIVSAIDWDEIPDEDVEDIIAKIEGEDEEDSEAAGDIGGEESVDIEAGGDEDPFAEEGGEELAESEEEEKEEEKEEVKESKTFSKKQLMETFLKKNVKNSLKKVLKENRTICEECLGEGCESCGMGMEEHHNLSHTNYGKYDDDEYITMKEDDMDMLSGDDVGVVHEDIDDTHDQMLGQDVLYRPGQEIELDRDYDGISNKFDLDNDNDGSLDYGMGNKMYDWPERIFGRKGDRDSDGIPNSIDIDPATPSWDEEDDYVEIDFEDLMGNAPVKEPDVAPTKPGTRPTTRPGKPRWKQIPRPGKNPKPKGIRERKKPSIKRKGIYK